MTTTLSAVGQAGTRNSGRRLGVALLVIATAQLMVVLDATIVNVALPRIQVALGFSGSGLEWVVNAYALALGGLLLLGGRAGDMLGRRRMLVTGLLAGAAASAGGLYWLSRVTEHGTYAGGLLGPILLTGAGLGLLIVPLPLVAITVIRVRRADLAGS